MKDQNKLLLITDLASYGKVAMSAMNPILSHMRFDLFNLPTALVSNPFQYGKFDILDTTSYIKNTLAIWEELNFSFDAIVTGIILTEEQTTTVYDYCKSQSQNGVPVFVDPIMGDNGELYNGIPESTIAFMQKLCSVGKIIFPNVTEACLLSGMQTKSAYSMDDIKFMLDKLHGFGAENVVITSVTCGNNKYMTVVSQADGKVFYNPYEQIEVYLPGTGDIFSSFVVGMVLTGTPLNEAVLRSMRNMEKLITLNANNADKYKGIPIEQYLHDLDL